MTPTKEPPERPRQRRAETLTDVDRASEQKVWQASSGAVTVSLSALPDGGASMEFYSEGDGFLRLETSVRGLDEVGTLRVTEGERRLRWTIDLSRYEETHHGFITGSDDGYPFSGSYDPRAEHCTVNVSLAQWLSSTTMERMAEVQEDLETLAAEWEKAREPYESDIEDFIAHSRLRDRLEAACWALAGMMTQLGGGANIPDVPHHHAMAAKAALAGLLSYAAARCAKIIAQEHGGGPAPAQ